MLACRLKESLNGVGDVSSGLGLGIAAGGNVERRDVRDECATLSQNPDRESQVHRCRGLETEVLGLHPCGLAIAIDDDRQAGFLVAEHGVPDTLLEGLVDQMPFLDE